VACLERFSLAAVLAGAAGIAPREARAQDAFEIQVYDGTANAPGVPGLELHLNDWVSGHRGADSPEAPLHAQFHATLEPSFGVFPFWEIGAYVQFADRQDDGRVDWAGTKLRSKFVTPDSWSDHWRLGVNLEVSYIPKTYDRDVWGSEIRPIAAFHGAGWLVALNPILDQSLAGPGASDGPVFVPALKVTRELGPVALGIEYYGSLGPIAAPLPLREEEHYLFEVVDVLAVQNVEVNAGIGEGLTPASAGITLKAILGYAFDRPAAPAPAGEEMLR
jgi:hypothetical protein